MPNGRRVVRGRGGGGGGGGGRKAIIVELRGRGTNHGDGAQRLIYIPMSFAVV